MATTPSESWATRAASGGSIALAGLIRDETQQSVSGTPVASKVPVLGALFRHKAIERNETELVIIATPYLVRPTDEKDLKLPTDGFQSPNDIQRIFGNMENNGKSGASRPLPSAAPEGAPPPQVGDLTVPAAVSQPADKRAKKKSRTADAAGATPGFSLN